MKIYDGHEGEYRVCCSCDHRVCCSCDHRITDKWHCDIDNHLIGYVECFDNWCRHWTDKVYKTLFDKNGVRK